MNYISTFIRLPPGIPSSDIVRELVHLAFREYRWFQPVHYGRAVMHGHLPPGATDYSGLLAYYEEFQSITITAQTERDFLMLMPSQGPEFPFVGKLVWATSLTEAKKAGWRDAHLRQVVEVMRLLGSPLAHTSTEEDLDRKTQRLVPLEDGEGQEEVSTVRDPSEGLAGLFWRNVFGPPFARMFGERLLALPPDTVRELGDGLTLVQPYALPTQAMTPEGDAAEARLITVLGPECFYDHQRHRKPTRVPDLSP